MIISWKLCKRTKTKNQINASNTDIFQGWNDTTQVLVSITLNTHFLQSGYWRIFMILITGYACVRRVFLSSFLHFAKKCKIAPWGDWWVKPWSSPASLCLVLAYCNIITHMQCRSRLLCAPFLQPPLLPLLLLLVCTFCCTLSLNVSLYTALSFMTQEWNSIFNLLWIHIRILGRVKRFWPSCSKSKAQLVLCFV